jgi:hypothetical protein
MIQIEPNDLQSGIEYYIEFHYNNHNNNNNEKKKYIGTFIENTIFTIYDSIYSINKNINNSYFQNVTQIQPIQIYMNNMTYTDPTNGSYSWIFYQISEPIIYQKSIDRLYENAIHIQLRNITGDKYFIF